MSVPRKVWSLAQGCSLVRGRAVWNVHICLASPLHLLPPLESVTSFAERSQLNLFKLPECN